MNNQKIHITYKQLLEDCDLLGEQIKNSGKNYGGIYAIPRGGVPIGVALAKELSLPLLDKPTSTCLIVDDLIDSGSTLEEYSGYDIAVLYRKPHSPDTYTFFVREYAGWLVFPFEETDKDIKEHTARLLEYIGADPTAIPANQVIDLLKSKYL